MHPGKYITPLFTLFQLDSIPTDIWLKLDCQVHYQFSGSQIILE